MIRLLTDRAWKKDGYTIGRFFVNGKRLCESLEDKDRGLDDSMEERKIKSIKVYGETAIPSGTYEVELTYSSAFKDRSWAKKYGGLVPQIMDVKCYSGVRIHPANKATELLGCIAVGKNTKPGMVTNSVKTYYELMDKYLIPAHESKEKIIIEIR